MRSLINLLALLSFLIINSVFAQPFGPVGLSPNGIPDIAGGMALKQHIPTKPAVAYESVREADVIWSKRTWESIDLRQKSNHALYFPFDEFDSRGNLITNNTRISLWNVLRWNIIYGNLTIFSPYNPYQYTIRDGDQLKYPVLSDTPNGNFQNDSVFRDKLFYYLGNLGPQPTTPLPNSVGDDSVVWIDNDNFEYVYPARDTAWIMAQDLVAYRLKEDWFFDKERSVLDVRIIALAPVVHEKDQQGQITGEKELFWIYFPHCRLVMNNYYTFNSKNDVQWMSFDDLFWKRKFTAVTYKESNIYDREIESYRFGTDALQESGKIKNEIRNIEQDVWNF